MLAKNRQNISKFQSTQPKRAATSSAFMALQQRVISIHAAQEGCDQHNTPAAGKMVKFQSTQPKRAATL